MADPTPAPTGSTKLVIRNIGQILSGKIEEPLIDGDCVVCEGDRIVAVGAEEECERLGRDLGPLGLKLDYKHLEETRPVIAEMLR